MFLRDGEGVKRSDESRFPALFNRKVVAQPAGNGEFPIDNRKNATEEKQISGIRGLDVSTQRCRKCWQNQSELANPRTWRGDPLRILQIKCLLHRSLEILRIYLFENI